MVWFAHGLLAQVRGACLRDQMMERVIGERSGLSQWREILVPASLLVVLERPRVVMTTSH